MKVPTNLTGGRHDPASVNPKAWALALRFRELAGERLSRYQRDAWREALGHGVQVDPDSRTESELPYESTT